jgi:hypothetical protein
VIRETKGETIHATEDYWRNRIGDEIARVTEENDGGLREPEYYMGLSVAEDVARGTR